MRVILVTGASGMLGGNLAADWAGLHEVHGVFHQHRTAIAGVQMIGADLTDRQKARTVMGKVKPDLVVHCAAATDLDRCQREPAWADRLNREMAANVADAARRVDSKLIHISTDAVFDGSGGPYQEGDEPNPLSIYGQSKLAGERAVLGHDDEALVIRTNLFGWTRRPGRLSLSEWFLDKLRRAESCVGFADVFFSPILANDLGPILLDLADSGFGGLFHIGGADCLSKDAFGRKLADAFGYSDDLIEPGSVENIGFDAPRARRLCLDSSKAEAAIGSHMPSVDAGIERMKQRAPEGWVRSTKHGRIRQAGEPQPRRST
jgi:dTDP-4-dehydrorhamnose reductase